MTHARDLARRAVHRPPDRALVGRRARDRRGRRLDRLGRPRRAAAGRARRAPGAEPGPACYGRGGSGRPSPTRRLVLGYLDPDDFLGGRMRLDLDAARAAIATARRAARRSRRGGGQRGHHASPASTWSRRSARSPINQGVDPREAPGRRRRRRRRADDRARSPASSAAAGCSLPRRAGALSACGGQFRPTSSASSRDAACSPTRRRSTSPAVERGAGRGSTGRLAGFGARAARARHLRGHGRATSSRPATPHQVWDLEIPLDRERIATRRRARGARRELSTRTHKRVFAVEEPGQLVECLVLEGPPGRRPGEAAARRARPGGGLRAAPARPSAPPTSRRRRGRRPRLRAAARCRPATGSPGPALIAEPTTTVVVPPEARARP